MLYAIISAEKLRKEERRKLKSMNSHQTAINQ